MFKKQGEETFQIEVEEVKPTVKARLQELNLVLSPKIDYDLENIFPKVEGWGWKTQMTQKHKLLNLVENHLEKCLLDSEKVLYIAKGNQHSRVVQLFMGIWANGISHTVFVLTNVRLLMIRSNGSGKPKQTFWMIYYSQIAKFKSSWHGYLKLSLKDRKTISFTGFPKADRKTMPVIFEKALENFRKTKFNPAVSQSQENLCSHCFDQIPKKSYTCGTCGEAFWSPVELALRSLFFPSWGDFLMGHHMLSFVELFGGIASWTYLTSGVMMFFRTGKPEELFVPMLCFAIFNGFDALLTLHIANKGLHPKKALASSR